jgi:hypothetical protein
LLCIACQIERVESGIDSPSLDLKRTKVDWGGENSSNFMPAKIYFLATVGGSFAQFSRRFLHF